jgi:hypothetical protein
MMRRWLTRPVAAVLVVALSVQSGTALGSAGGTVDARVTISPLTVVLALGSSEAPAGSRIQARATVANLGPLAVGPIVVTLRADRDGIAVRGSDLTKTIRRLAGGKASTVSWVICGREPGGYVLLASAALGEVSIDSPAVLLTITGTAGASC